MSLDTRTVSMDVSEDLREVLVGFLVDRGGTGAARAALDSSAYDADLWRELTHGLGVAALGIPEAYDGAGDDRASLLTACREFGRVLAPTPFFATTVLAATAYRETANVEVMGHRLPGLASGTTATLAVCAPDGEWAWDGAGVQASANAQLVGERLFVPDGDRADLIIVVANDGVGPVLYECERSAVEVEALSVLDPTRPLSRVRFDGTPARRIDSAVPAPEVLRRVHERALLALAAEATGGAEQCLSTAVEYAKSRVAFGRPIGGFQAIKHKLADLFIEVAFAQAAITEAMSRTLDPTEVAAVFGQCVDSFVLAAVENIHVHGGIGFTWEHDAHLYHRRAVATANLMGPPSSHYETVAAGLLGGGAP